MSSSLLTVTGGSVGAPKEPVKDTKAAGFRLDKLTGRVEASEMPENWQAAHTSLP